MTAFATVPTKASGDPYTLAMWNTSVRDNLNKLGDRMHRVVTVAAFATLTPEDADEVYLEVDATAGVYWHLRYRSASASAYKWEYLGGSPLVSSIDIAENTPITTYGDCATVGPAVAIPRAGDYDVTIGAQFYGSIGAGGSLRMSYAIGAAAAADGAEIFSQNSVAMDYHYLTRLKRQLGLTAVTLTAKYYYTVTIAQVANRAISIVPVRIS